ncbi:MAG: DUF6580 family putative transport protein [Saprospiraceae bacterium]
MTGKSITPRWIILVLIIFIAALYRLVPLAFNVPALSNFTPIGAMALFGGAYFGRKYAAFLLPFLALWLSNLILDNVFFARYYDGFAWFTNWEVYLAFALIVVLGIFLLKKVSVMRLLGASLFASILFFLVTNFFVWFSGTMYPKTAEGLFTCYVAAIPFFGNTVAGNLFFVAVLFGAFEWAQRTYPALQLEKG